MATITRHQITTSNAVGFAAITLAIVVAGARFASPVVVGLLTGVGAIALAFNTASSEELRQRRYLTIGFAFSLYYAVAFGFGVLGPPPTFAARVLPDGLTGVDLTSLPVAYLAWFFGYRLIGNRWAGRAVFSAFLSERSVAAAPATIGLVYAATVAARMLLLGGDGFGYLRNAQDATTNVSSIGQYVAEFGSFGVVLLGIVLVASYSGGSPAPVFRRMTFWIVPIELFFGVLVGQKSEFLFVVLMVGAVRVVMTKLDYRRLIAASAIALLFIFPFTETYRSILRPTDAPQLEASKAPGALIDAFGQTADAFVSSPMNYFDYAFERTVGRVREIDRAAVSIQTHDGGRPYTSAIRVPERAAENAIPRVLWPGKPIDLYGLEVSRDYYGIGNNVISASSLSPVGDAYRHGGLVMVAVLFFLLGGFARTLDLAFDHRRTMYALPLLLASMPLIRAGDLAGILTGSVRYFVLLYPVLRFALRVSPSVPERLSSTRVAIRG